MVSIFKINHPASEIANDNSDMMIAFVVRIKIHFALLTLAEKAGKLEEVEVIKVFSPIARRYVNLLGSFEFQRPQISIDIDEIIKVLGREIVWQK